MAKTDYLTVDLYIADQPEAVRPALHRVRALLREALPHAEEGISYQIPALRTPGGSLYFAGYNAHYSIYPATQSILDAIGEDVAPYLSGKATIRFPLSEPIPEGLIRRIVAAWAAGLGTPKRPRTRKS